MTKVQFIKTMGGEELAILPKSEYERLTARVGEDEGTARIVRRTRAALAAGHEIMLPKTVVDRLAAGQKRDMTQAELAVSAGITQGYLSELEAGQRKRTVAV